MAVEADAALLKQLAVQVEEEQPFGRLLDIDVFDATGVQLSRDAAGQAGRLCFVCDEPAILCIRGRRHDAQAVATAVAKLVGEFYKQEESI